MTSLLNDLCLQPKPLMQQTPAVTIVEPPVPKEPPPEFEFLADPPTISALDLYVLLCIFVCVSFVEKALLLITVLTINNVFCCGS